MAVRAKLYELLSHCIPPTIVLKIAERVVKKVEEALKADVMRWAAFYPSTRFENSITQGLLPHLLN
ncbi:hypothetical protein BKA70DRAFT_1421678 [Coprinopsis sp. MPI-PUGE-AT-0042]|nr:hypothetical protein BKA70DRAFT_1421678 [Coprinopsis sp. MPI-PUGE-AT-0042]